MSAPNTTLEKQTRRHRGPLRGMFAVVIFALVLLLFLGFWAFRSGSPEGSAVQVQSGLGTDGSGQDSAVSANTDANDDVDGAVVGPDVDPTAVTVPSLRVEHPQSGTAGTVNPLVAPSDSAVPLDPVAPEDGGRGVVAD